MKKILPTYLFLVLLTVNFHSTNAEADCLFSEEQNVSITVLSCFYHDPAGENSLVREHVSRMSMTDEQKNAILERYAGIIVSVSGEFTDPKCESGEIDCLRPRVDYFYPTQDRDACNQFPKDEAVSVAVIKACCDGDPNPPCMMGFSNLIKGKYQEAQ